MRFGDCYSQTTKPISQALADLIVQTSEENFARCSPTGNTNFNCDITVNPTHIGQVFQNNLGCMIDQMQTPEVLNQVSQQIMEWVNDHHLGLFPDITSDNLTTRLQQTLSYLKASQIQNQVVCGQTLTDDHINQVLSNSIESVIQQHQNIFTNLQQTVVAKSLHKNEGIDWSGIIVAGGILLAIVLIVIMIFLNDRKSKF